jgi:hypothetical protein
MFGWEWQEILTLMCLGGLYLIVLNWLIRRESLKHSR